ncbi:hypothetical protein SRHO_G00045870 [Serrasalmus rhombeus]
MFCKRFGQNTGRTELDKAVLVQTTDPEEKYTKEHIAIYQDRHSRGIMRWFLFKGAYLSGLCTLTMPPVIKCSSLPHLKQCMQSVSAPRC